jgi:DNA-directed RNA polymerase beta' subunit
MNCHVPQSYEAHTELEEIAAVPMQIIRPRDGQPVIGVVQDTLVGAHLATKAGNRFNRREFMNLMMRNKRFHGLPTAGDDGKYTGQQVISTMLAPINMKMNNGLYDANKVTENTVIIREGEVIQGVFDKGTFNKPGSGIVHTTYNDYGPKDAVQLIDSMQNVLENYLIMKGFSVGISDLVPDEETQRQMQEKIATAKAEVADIAMQVHMDLFTNNTGKSNQDEFEARVNGVLARAFDAGKIGQTSLSSENRLIAMINAGSKGSSMNIAQMLACVGPVSIDGKRIAYGFADRTLPHYKKFDDGPEARGFVESCFLRGLTPQEFFFHAMSGREGLIDTAVKSVTGDTPIVILEEGVPKYVEIGPWIDSQLAADEKSVEHFTERQMELLQVEKKVFIPTMDEDGVVTWGALSAITRHDPGTELYEIKTSAGKKVIVTESKSLLTWNAELSKFKEVPTPEVKVGDYVPVTMNLCEPPTFVTEVMKDNTPIVLKKENAVVFAEEISKTHVIPTEFFVAPKDFVETFLEGIMVGNSSIKSESSRFLEAIAMLYSRLGIFASISYNVLTVGNAPIVKNDVVMDKIVEINIIDVAKYPKVYDLTIPSTLNFGLANGLQVRDTSDTGYTQRQLIKAMEDVMIQHDGTVRDAAGAIIQFHYGEDGTNSTKIESSAVPMEKGFEKADTDIIAKYSMNGVDLAPYLKEDTTRESDGEALLAYANTVAQDRHMIIQYVYGMSKNSQPINTPLNLERIILNMKTKFGLRAQTIVKDDQGHESPTQVRTNLTPLTVLNGINAMIKKTQSYNKIWVASLRFFLAPHKMIVEERFTQEAWDALVETIVVKNYKSWAVPGELVGIIAAQSIGEPTTQMTLNTFHLAGVAAKSNMTRGVPRVKELLKVTRNPKATSLTVYIKPAFRQNKDAVREVLQDFELTLLKDIVQKSAIYYDPHERETIIEEDRELIEFYNLFEGLEPEEKKSPSKWLLRLTFDRELMFNKNITMDDVNVILSNKFGEQVKLTYSDYNSQRLIMRIRIAPGDNTYGDDLEGLKKFQNKLLNSVIMRGLPGIKSASMRKYSDMLEYDGSKYTAVDQYIIDTDGSNYTEVMAHPAVDGSKLYSTNVHDINEHLGIEATRQALYIELKTVFEDANVNYRHMGLLCDVMTRGGKLMSIDRYGINKINIGPLAKASFEETEKMLMKAALFGEVDPVTGVSANIMMGQTIRGGTAFSQIMLDEASLPRLLEGLPAHPEGDEDEDIVQLSDTNIGAVLYEDPNDACSKTRLQMNFVLPKSKTMIEEEDEDDVEFKVK